VDQTVASGGDVAVDSPSPPPRREQSVNIAEDLGAAGRNLTEPRVKPVNHIMRRRKEEKDLAVLCDPCLRPCRADGLRFAPSIALNL
jgi:hypothetical protein